MMDDSVLLAYSVQDFMSWIEKKSGRYDYMSGYNCAGAQYVKSKGFNVVHFSSSKLIDVEKDGNYFSLLNPKWLQRIDRSYAVHYGTFGHLRNALKKDIAKGEFG